MAAFRFDTAVSIDFTSAPGRSGHSDFALVHTLVSAEKTTPARVQSAVRAGYSPNVVDTRPSPSRSTSRRLAGTVPFLGHLSPVAASLETELPEHATARSATAHPR